jgi:NhaP-type Na+/H+ or K+/H+ antiporter
LRHDAGLMTIFLPFNSLRTRRLPLPLLLFHAALTIDVCELVDDAAPILTLAVVTVFVCAAAAICFPSTCTDNAI